MKNTRSIGLLVIGGLLVCTAAIYLYSIRETPVLIGNLSPRSSDASASAEYLNAQKAVEYYRDAIRSKPEIIKNYVELAQIYIQEARVTALHHEYFPKAERLLNEALKREPNDFNAMITKAGMQATLHQFEEAKELARKTISLNPYNAFSYGVLVDCLVELGEYDEAVKACDKMLSIRPDLRSYARASYLREIHGDIEGAKQAMRMAGDAGVFGQENRAWAFYNLGKLYLNEGELDTAEFIFNGILQERPNYAYALSGLAHIKSARERYDEASELLKKAWDMTPEHIFLEELADVYRATGQTALAEATIEKVIQEFSDHINEGWNVDREYALFCSNHEIDLEQALVRAKREHTRRPNNIEVLDTYAWTLLKNGKADEAVSVIEKALRLGTKQSAMKYHAGMIYKALGNQTKAREYLQQALTMNPYINVLYVSDARKALSELHDVATTN
jgi:pentatricopeptide repeat protein